MSCLKIYLLIILIALLLPGSDSAVCQSISWVQLSPPGNAIVHSIVFDSADNIYAGTDNGIYRSTDGGADWDLIGMAKFSIGPIMIGKDHKIFIGIPNTSTVGLYSSTDEGDHWIGLSAGQINSFLLLSNSYIIAGGDAFYRSTDNGLHWYYNIYTAFPHAIVALVEHSAGYCFAGTWNGVFRSSDRGKNWEPYNTGLEDTDVRAMTIDTIGCVYAGVWGTSIFRSLDYGITWRRVDSGLTNPFISSLIANSVDYVYAGTNWGGVYLSTDNGDSWTPVDSGLTNIDINCLAVDSKGFLFAGTNGGGIFRSQHSTTAVRRIPGETPERFSLYQNYPNPFNPSTTISYAIPKESTVRIAVYDILGHEVEILRQGKQVPGEYQMTWNAAERPSGIYFYRLQAGNFTGTKKMLVIR